MAASRTRVGRTASRQRSPGRDFDLRKKAYGEYAAANEDTEPREYQRFLEVVVEKAAIVPFANWTDQDRFREIQFLTSGTLLICFNQGIFLASKMCDQRVQCVTSGSFSVRPKLSRQWEAEALTSVGGQSSHSSGRLKRSH